MVSELTRKYRLHMSNLFEVQGKLLEVLGLSADMIKEICIRFTSDDMPLVEVTFHDADFKSVGAVEMLLKSEPEVIQVAKPLVKKKRPRRVS
jgi:hypothetical protein